MPNTTTKVCNKCGLAKSLGEFTPTATSVRSRCRPCVAEDRRARRQANPAKERAQDSARRAADPARFRERDRQYRESNPEEVRRKRKKWRDAHPEVATASVRNWQKRNPEAVRRALDDFKAKNPDYFAQASRKRRAIRKGATIGEIDLARLWIASGGVCGLCHLDIDETLCHPDPMSRSIDHIIPLSLGGSHEQSNLQWSHLRCNLKKGNRPTP